METTMSNKQSSVEWFNQELKNLLSKYGYISEKMLSIHFNRAKKMHKEEINKAILSHIYANPDAKSEQYYNETFGGDNERNLSE